MLAELFTLVVLLGVFLFTILLLHGYPAKNTHPIVYFFVFIGWFNSFVIITLIPYDIYLSLGGSGNTELLRATWMIVYWSIFVTCWIILPVMNSYFNSGEFTFKTKLKEAIFKESKSYAIIFGIIGGFLLYLYLAESLSISSIPNTCILLSNLWGLLLIVLLLGFGLVSIPVKVWKRADLSQTLDTLHMKAAGIQAKRKDYKDELHRAVGKIVELQEKVKNDPKLLYFVDIILSECPQDFVKSYQSTITAPEVVKYNEIVKAHKKMKDLLFEIQRNRWYLVNRVFGKY